MDAKTELAKRIKEISAGMDAEKARIAEAQEVIRVAEINVQRLEGAFQALRGLMLAIVKEEEKPAKEPVSGKA